MPSSKQIEANRRNAQRSTGPRTEAGKSASRMNALKSGMHARSLVIFNESPSDLDTLIQEYFDRFRPATPEERALVDTLVNAEWMLRRLRRIEPELWETHYRNYDQHTATFKHTNTPLAFIYMGIAKELDRLQTRINAFDRAWHRAFMSLANLQKQRQATADGAPQPSHAGAARPKLASFRKTPPQPPEPVAPALESGGISPQLACFRQWRETWSPPES